MSVSIIYSVLPIGEYVVVSNCQYISIPSGFTGG